MAKEAVNSHNVLTSKSSAGASAHAPAHPAHDSVLDKTVTFKINVCPRTALKWFLFVLVMVTVFFLGRFTATPTANMAADLPLITENSADVSVAASDDSAEKNSTEEKSEEDGPSFFSSLLNSITGLFTASDDDAGNVSTKNETNASAAPALENVTVTAEETAVENETAVNDTAKNETEEVEEIVITDYKYVKLTLDSVYKKWMGTWGKITGIEYTIVNNEGGTIKPHHFIIIVEGYPDVNKEFIVPYTTEKIKSKVTLKDSAAVSGGFAYNEKTAGDLTGVDIQLYLYDASGKVIASTLKSVNLQG
ncbi:MAG: hypothetical protein AB1668_07230 [Nanoarchaeota archaeon]